MTRTVLRLALGLLIVLHGLVHLTGTAAGLGWGDTGLVVSPVAGWAWLVVCLLTVAAGIGFIAGRRRWWWLGAPAAAGSLALLAGHWPESAVGLVPDVVLLAAVAHSWWRSSPRSLPGRYRRGVAATPVPVPARGVVTEADLAGLPAPVAGWLRRTGAVGRPRVTRVRATLRGRIRGGPDEPWMTFTGEQVNTYGPRPTRHFLLDATRAGLPIDVLHVLTDGRALMTARLLSVIPVVDAAGPAMDLSEAVTLFDDLCLLAPAALIDAPVTWQPIDDRRVRATYRTGGQEVGAVLEFDESGDLRNLTSDDRLRAEPDGSFTPMRWDTPVHDFRDTGGRRLPGTAGARWHAPAGTFSYAELTILAVESGP
ncbi:DUF6544 family protein [Cellulomonas denverensis]|uniref:Uncharacterized protein n=1 Tax=Cellulomonas denverensis TaxID=264297 RepID=A0A7X6QYE9_9CELL|nr:DUF6544 family protein [Cellulomonas denverensis]NKY22043.1 hypothetical protein [Cellulomonas denverensis]GIG27218.1 hypothetical protein Cde04nite_34620 [Cellulomonas denverensis]